MRAMHRQIFRFFCEGMPKIQGGGGLSQRERTACTHFLSFMQLRKLNFGFQLGSAAYKKLEENLTRPRLIKAIRKLSDYHQTLLEAKHALDNKFATKNIIYQFVCSL